MHSFECLDMRLSLIIKHLCPAGMAEDLSEAHLHFDWNKHFLIIPSSLLVFLLIHNQLARNPFNLLLVLWPHLLLEPLILDNMADNVGVMLDCFHDGDVDEIKQVQHVLLFEIVVIVDLQYIYCTFVGR